MESPLTLIKSDMDNTLVVVDGADELLTSKHLASFYLAISTRIKGYICLCCSVALNSPALVTHFQKFHKDVTFGDDAQALTNAAGAAANLPPEYTEIEPSDEAIPSVDGIKIRNVAGCPYCSYTANSKGVSKHMSKKHSELDGNPIKGIKAQSLNSGKRNVLFRVTPKNIPPPENLPLTVQQFLDSFSKIIPPASSVPNARHISPWLLRTKFHYLLLNREPTQLCYIVRSLGEDEFEGLHASISEYFETASRYIDSSDELVLQFLNTADPDKEGINNRPLTRHSQHETTQAAYTQIIVRLVTSLLREPSSVYTIPTSDNLDAAILILKKDVSIMASIHGLLLALWKTSWPVSQPDTIADPTIAFLGLISLHSAGHFKLPADVTPIIAKLTRAILLVMLTEMHRMVERQECLTLLDAYQLLAPYIHEKHHSTFNSLRSLQHYASALAYNTLSQPRIVWIDTENYTSLLYEGRELSLVHIHQFFVQLEHDAVDLWEKEILLGESVHLEYDILADHLRETKPGYSFITDPQNPFHARAADLGKLLIPKYFTLHISATGVVFLDSIKVNKWLSSLAKLEGLLMVSAEVKGGAPARGTEITSMTMNNPPYRYRNGMGIVRHFALVRQYDKTTHNFHDRLIPHSLDAVTADLLIHVHTFARPLAQHFARHAFPNGDEVARMYGTMMFMNYGDEFTSANLSDLMAECTDPIMLWEVRINAWRHCHTALKEKHCHRTFDSLTEQHASSTIHALQSGHSLDTEKRIYGLSPESMMGHSTKVFQLFLEASTEWQIVNRIVPGGLGLSYRRARAENFSDIARTLPKAFKSASVKTIQESFDQQSLRLQAIESKLDSILELLVTPPSTLPSTARTETTLSSLPSSSPPSGYLDNVDSSTPPSSFLSQEGNNSTVSMLLQLQTLYGSNAKWTCPEQKEAVDALVQRKRDVILALRTGIGKTAIAMLPSMVEDCYTIIICPLVSLIEDWGRRLSEKLIHSEIYTGDMTRLEGQANIILATSDAIRSSNWKVTAFELNERRPIGRFVFDEAQYWFTDLKFRQRVMADPFLLRSSPTQFVLMSGTIPPISEPFLIKNFGLHNPLLIRHHSSRIEIRYRRLPPVRDLFDASTALDQLLREATLHFAPEDRFLIFITSIDDGKRLADRLKLDIYHAHSEAHPLSDSERRLRYQRWIDGKKTGMVCSSALGAGNDYAHVRFTVHINNPFDLITFAQQSGRAARDHKPGTSYLIPYTRLTFPKPDGGPDLSGRIPMQLFTRSENTECFRSLMSGFLDGEPHRCAELEGAIPCDMCVTAPDPPPSRIILPAQPSSQDVPSLPFQTVTAAKRSLEEAFGPALEQSRSRERDIRVQQIRHAKDLLEFLQIIGRNCAYCFVLGVQPVGEHYGDNCSTLRANNLCDSFVHEFRGQLHYPKPTDGSQRVRVCFNCHVTQGDPRISHPPFAKHNRAACPYPNVVPQIAFAVFTNSTLQQAAQQKFATAWASLGEFTQWCVGRHENYLWQTNANALVAWYMDNIN